ncbi:hypothetical protein BH24CHL4_BH24CHL4_15430 [soil metagenome]
MSSENMTAGEACLFLRLARKLTSDVSATCEPGKTIRRLAVLPCWSPVDLMDLLLMKRRGDGFLGKTYPDRKCCPQLRRAGCRSAYNAPEVCGAHRASNPPRCVFGPNEPRSGIGASEEDPGGLR